MRSDELAINKKITELALPKPFSNIVMLCGVVFFYFMMVTPRTYQAFRLQLLIVILIATVILTIYNGKLYINKRVFNWAIIYVVFGITWGIFGYYVGKDYSIDFLRLNVFWVIVYLLLISAISKFRHIEVLMKVMVYAALSIALYNLFYITNAVGLFTIPLIDNLDMGQRIGVHPGYVQLTAHNIGSLFYLVPYLYAILIVSNKGEPYIGMPKWLLYFTFAVCLVAVFFTGRRMLWLIILITPFLFLLVNASVTKNISKTRFTIVILVILFIIFAITIIFFVYLNFDSENFLDRALFTNDQGVFARLSVIREIMIDLNNTNLFLGTGGGSPPFEIFIFTILHETGVFGLIIFLGLFFWIYYKMIILLRKHTVPMDKGLPILFGSITFLIGMFSNPYFNSFDFMWTIFFPLSFINVYYRELSI